MKRLITLLASAILMAMSAFAAIDPPTYPGGNEEMKKYISENLKYPAPAKENGIEGVVNVAFLVRSDGSIGSIKIVRMIDPDLEMEAIRLVKNMPKWNPATDGGKPVEATATIGIPFIISEE